MPVADDPVLARPAAEARRLRREAGLWSRGFRPFFLVAAIWAVTAIALWPPFFTGEIAIPTAFSAVDWHVHEMIYGYGAAVMSGFLLTAIPNWTGRLPVAGRPLAWLVALWAVGRVAVFFSAMIGAALAAALDVAFLLVFAAVIGREVIAAKNQRNLKVVVLVLLLALANAAFHIEAAMTGAGTVCARAGLAIIVFLILLIGGRVVPSFTHNWLARKGLAPFPTPFGRPDEIVMALSAAALILWVASPEGINASPVLFTAGGANLWRLSRWRGWATRSDLLLLVLHAGFFFAALGFLPAALHAARPDLFSNAVATHLWAIGAIGTMTLAMMSRATLGHSGRELTASGATQFCFAAVVAALLARLAAELVPTLVVPLICGAAIAWVAAFATFIAAYGSMLTRPATKAN